LNLISTRYAFTSAYLKGEESRCVSAEHVDWMIQKSTMEDALEVIENTDIGDYLRKQPIKTFDEADEYLWKYLGECLKRLERFKLPSEIVHLADAYIKKYDILNIKIAVRSVLMEKPATMALLGVIYNQGYLEKLLSIKSVDEIAEIIVMCNLGDYASLIKDIKEKDFISEAEIRLDGMYYEGLLSALRKIDDGHLVTKAVGIIIDLENLQMVFRSVLGKKEFMVTEFVLEGGYVLSANTVREFLSLKMNEITGRLEHTEYCQLAQEISRNFEKDGNITIINKLIDKLKFQLLKDLLSPRVLSSSNMLWYLILKEWEIRNVRLIIKTLEDGIPPSDIKDYMVIAS
jgi:V/A-type H+-transporting ATPase subunit C